MEGHGLFKAKTAKKERFKLNYSTPQRKGNFAVKEKAKGRVTHLLFFTDWCLNYNKPDNFWRKLAQIVVAAATNQPGDTKRMIKEARHQQQRVFFAARQMNKICLRHS